MFLQRSSKSAELVLLIQSDHAPATNHTVSLPHAANTVQVLLLENTRLHPGEEINDAALAQQLASCGDVFVNDAFGACHRDQATVTGLARHMRRCYPGLLVRKEVQYLTSKLRNPARCAHSSGPAHVVHCVCVCSCSFAHAAAQLRRAWHECCACCMLRARRVRSISAWADNGLHLKLPHLGRCCTSGSVHVTPKLARAGRLQ